MALRAFRLNPQLGGFGGESAPPAGTTTLADVPANTNPHLHCSQNHDAFSQIIKELVDNAVDACSASALHDVKDTLKEEQKRVRVVIEPDKATWQDEENGQSPSPTTTVKEDVLRITVTDNGCGMNNIQDCVEAFQSSKGPSDTEEGACTAGRYGVGLTLCLVHAQRLVPDSCASITSSTKTSTAFCRASYVVDTDGDKVQCVKLERLDKNHPTESGTAVKLLLPGGDLAKQSWPRLASYLARFQLSLGLTCSLQVLAPSLSKLPLYVRSQAEIQRKWKARVDRRRKAAKHQHVNLHDKISWKETLDETSDEDVEAKASNLENPSRRNLKNLKDRSKENWMAAAVSSYLSSSVEEGQVAYSSQPIRQLNGESCNGNKVPTLEVYLVVKGPSWEASISSDMDKKEGTDEKLSAWRGEDDGETVGQSRPAAKLELIRLVNHIPLLDGAEAAACGLVRCITQKGMQSVWNSFGLHASEYQQSVGNSTPTFAVRDSDHVQPFFCQDTHTLYEEKADIRSSEDEEEDEDDALSEEEEDDEDDDTVATDQVRRCRRPRRKTKKKQTSWMMPAHVRLGNLLLIVHIFQADPSTLPLPTLSKGRLPMHHDGITKAFEKGVAECCRKLQRQSQLLLTPQQLKATVRDVRYVPAVAEALAHIVCHSPTVDQHAVCGWMKLDEVESTDEELLPTQMLCEVLEQKLRLACRPKPRPRKSEISSPTGRSKRRKTMDDDSLDSCLSVAEEASLSLVEGNRDIEVTPSSTNSPCKSLDSWDSSTKTALDSGNNDSTSQERSESGSETIQTPPQRKPQLMQDFGDDDSWL